MAVVGDYVDFQNGYAFKSKDFCENGDYDVIKIKELKDGKIKFTSDTAMVKYMKDIERYVVNDGDILFALTGDPISKPNPLSWVGRVSIYRGKDGAVINQRVCKVIPKYGLNPLYLYYFFRNNSEFYQLAAKATGSASQANISTKTISDTYINLPNIEYQNKVVGILSSLDEKIEINNKINDNLEDQAIALFRQYFMDFAPYGGVAPSEWTEVSLDDVCTRITDGSHYSPADSLESPYPMYSVKDMETYGFNPTSCKHISEEDFQKMQKGDCVPLLNDILVAKDGSYLKEIFICSEEKDEAILSSIAIFRPNTSIIMPEILLYLLKQPSIRKDVGDNYVSGSALPRIVLKDFKKYRFMLPPMDEQQKIGSVLHAIRMHTKANIDEIQCLSSLRDALLPKLMSGELDISRLDI